MRNKQTWQRRFNTAVALIIVLTILFSFNISVYALWVYGLWVSIPLSFLPLYNFPWYKFK